MPPGTRAQTTYLSCFAQTLHPVERNNCADCVGVKAAPLLVETISAGHCLLGLSEKYINITKYYYKKNYTR